VWRRSPKEAAQLNLTLTIARIMYKFNEAYREFHKTVETARKVILDRGPDAICNGF
jgi:hypothetical protein